MNKVTAIGQVSSGILKVSNRRFFDADLKTMPDCDVNITIEKRSRKRTTQQNRYYWGVVVMLCKRGFNDLGHDLNDEDTHTFLKSKFNALDLIFEDTGEVFPLGRSTTEMDTIDFNLYIEKIQQFAAQTLNIEIPDPI